VPGVNLPKYILGRMEAADISGNAQEEGVQIALELISRIKTYHKQGIHGIHLMPVGWDEIVPRIVVEAALLSKDFLFNHTSQEWNNAHHFKG
jgi:methylenetetrahydrofolate reductase (NADPH)